LQFIIFYSRRRVFSVPKMLIKTKYVLSISSNFIFYFFAIVKNMEEEF